MAKLQPKAVVKPFASEEINPNFQPTPVGEWAGGGAVTPSFDPEVLLENASQGITKMTVQSGTNIIILPSGSDIAGLYYSFTYFFKALQQTGIAEYSAVQDYHSNDITKAPSGSKIYRSLINDNIGNPLTDITKWEELDLLALKQATISQRGTLQIATISDINEGTNNTKALTIANLRASNILDEMMVGQVQTYARQNFSDFSINTGTGTWLYCNGRALLTDTYPLLFQRIGYFYGGSGASFNIPDLRERVVAGASSSEPINKKEGAKTHTLIEDELPVIRPKMQATTLTGSGGSDPTRLKGSTSGLQGALTSDGGTFTIQTTQSFGGGQPHNNMQPTIYLPYFIYAV